LVKLLVTNDCINIFRSCCSKLMPMVTAAASTLLVLVDPAWLASVGQARLGQLMQRRPCYLGEARSRCSDVPAGAGSSGNEVQKHLAAAGGNLYDFTPAWFLVAF
jgi:hypothetical protein